jgi:formyltetrahydrofolate synthetase
MRKRLLPIQDVARKLEIPEKYLEQLGLYGAKVRLELLADAALSAGAGFAVVISGSMMLMPGLPKVSRAVSIDVSDSGEIIGV